MEAKKRVAWENAIFLIAILIALLIYRGLATDIRFVSSDSDWHLKQNQTLSIEELVSYTANDNGFFDVKQAYWAKIKFSEYEKINPGIGMMPENRSDQNMLNSEGYIVIIEGRYKIGPLLYKQTKNGTLVAYYANLRPDSSGGASIMEDSRESLAVKSELSKVTKMQSINLGQ